MLYVLGRESGFGLVGLARASCIASLGLSTALIEDAAGVTRGIMSERRSAGGRVHSIRSHYDAASVAARSVIADSSRGIHG